MGNGIDGEMFPDKDKHPDCVGERAFAGKGVAGKGSTSFFFNSNQVSCVAITQSARRLVQPFLISKVVSCWNFVLD